MSRFYWICFMLLLVMPKPTYAQAEEGWSSGCDSKAEAVVASSTKLNFGASCKIFTTCIEAGNANGVCQMQALMTLRDGCADSQCVIEAQLYAATITVFNSAYNFDVSNGSKGSAEIDTIVPEALKAFQEGKYDEVAELYLNVPADIYIHPMLPLSAGLAYAAAGEQDKAMAAYDQAVQTSYLEPLSYYIRGNALAATHQHDDEAAIDFSLLDQYTAGDTSVSSIVKPLVDAYPFPETVFEKWTAYPVVWRGEGVAGSSMTDLTQDEPRAVLIAKLDGGKKLAAQNLSDLLKNTYNNLPQTMILKQAYDQTYSFSVSNTDDYGTWGGTIKVDLGSSPIQVNEYTTEFENGTSNASIIAPATEADPRLKFDAKRCPGAALSRLKIGEEGHAFTNSNPNGLAPAFDTVGGKQIGSTDHYIVMDGPKCQDNNAWWQIKLDDGRIGWASESQGNSYQLFPTNDTPIPPSRNGT